MINVQNLTDQHYILRGAYPGEGTRFGPVSADMCECVERELAFHEFQADAVMRRAGEPQDVPHTKSAKVFNVTKLQVS